MLISGFTFIRNALKYDFPIVECIESMLPLVDELVVNVGRSDDGTEELLAKVAERSPKIRLLSSVWDDAKTDRGLVLSEQTNIALDACRGRWALYLQADEALHEGEHAAIRHAIEEADRSAPDIEGLRLRYLHFYGGYTLVQRPWNWYPSEIRVVRRDSAARSYGDAQTFRVPDGGADRQLRTKVIDAHVYHYGHARAPEAMKAKIRYFHRFWHGDDHGISVDRAYALDWKKLVWFWGTHPAPYAGRVKAGQAWSPTPARLLEHEPQRIFVLASAASQTLAAELITLLKRHHPGAELAVGATLREARQFARAYGSRPRDNALVDLDAASRRTGSLIALSLTTKGKFGVRVAHVPSGELTGFARRYYGFISWARHQTEAQGFEAPRQEHARQLARWLGLAV